MLLCWTSPKVLAGNELFRVEKLPIRSCAHFIHDGRFEINLGISLSMIPLLSYSVAGFPITIAAKPPSRSEARVCQHQFH